MEIVVIGAGIVGISAALELQSRGRSVHLIDAVGVAKGASRGNAGAFAFSEVLPLATPRIMRQAPRWLLDPLGPLSIPPAYARNIAPWLWKFWRASLPKNFNAGVAAQAALMKLSQKALERQIIATSGAHLVRRDGQLQIYDTTRSFEASQADWDLRRQHGFACERIDGAEAISDIQPGLHARFRHGVFTPSWMNSVNPQVWAEHLAGVFKHKGGRFGIARALGIEPAGAQVKVHTENGTFEASRVVVATGAQAHQLAKTLGDSIPLETERGYNTTLPPGAFDLKTHLTFADHGFVVSKIDGGVRVGGAVELGGLKAPPNYERARFMLDKAATFLPGLKTSQGIQWMGFRPSLPDSLPVIGPARHARHVIYAFGHGHLGLTQSAGTAEIVADLCLEVPPAMTLAPFSPDRF